MDFVKHFTEVVFFNFQVATIGHMVDMWKGYYILPADICSIWSSEKVLYLFFSQSLVCGVSVCFALY